MIVGAGFTGLWTAYYLAGADPDLAVVVVEAARVGSGASGRNGGFCSPVLPIGLTALARRRGRRAAIDLQTAAVAALDEIESVLGRERIECGWRRGGMRWVATNPSQVGRLRRMVDEYRAFGFGPDHIGIEQAPDARVHGAMASAFSPHSAAVDPARLVWGLAEAAERRGVVILEDTVATGLRQGEVSTPGGRLSAPVVVRTTEGYTPLLAGHTRSLLPVYSHMIATPPLAADLWSEIGWDDDATLSDGARHFFYAQRTEGGRIAIGGRGLSYHWRSGISPTHDVSASISRRLRATLSAMFPRLPDIDVTHEWGGVLAIPRDWEPFVDFDTATGLGAAGGYSGDGVLLSNFAARCLADAVVGRSGRHPTPPVLARPAPRRWEPEPIRWLAVHGADRLARILDAGEDTGHPSRLGRWVFDKLVDD